MLIVYIPIMNSRVLSKFAHLHDIDRMSEAQIIEEVRKHYRPSNWHVSPEHRFKKRSREIQKIIAASGINFDLEKAFVDFYNVHFEPMDEFIKSIERTGCAYVALKAHDIDTKQLERAIRLESILYDSVVNNVCSYEEARDNFKIYTHTQKQVIEAFEAAGFVILTAQTPRGKYPRHYYLFMARRY